MKIKKYSEVSEKMSFKKYVKYNEFLMKQYRAINVRTFDEDGIMGVFLDYGASISSDIMEKILQDFNTSTYRICTVAYDRYNKNIRFEIHSIPKEYFDNIEAMIKSKKFNL
jgi:hypothetical protein